MKILTLEQKSLRVIDFMVSGGLSASCEYKRAFGRPFSQEEAMAMSDKITKIYEIAHSAIPEHSCYSVHSNWRERTLIMFKKLRLKGFVGTAGK